MCDLVEQAAEERLELHKEVAELNIAIEKRRQRVLVSESGHCSTSLFCSTLIAKLCAIFVLRTSQQSSHGVPRVVE